MLYQFIYWQTSARSLEPICRSALKWGIKMLWNGKKNALWNGAIKLSFCWKVVLIPQALSALTFPSNRAASVSEACAKRDLQSPCTFCVYQEVLLTVMSSHLSHLSSQSVTLWSFCVKVYHFSFDGEGLCHVCVNLNPYRPQPLILDHLEDSGSVARSWRTTQIVYIPNACVNKVNTRESRNISQVRGFCTWETLFKK